MTTTIAAMSALAVMLMSVTTTMTMYHNHTNRNNHQLALDEIDHLRALMEESMNEMHDMKQQQQQWQAKRENDGVIAEQVEDNDAAEYERPIVASQPQRQLQLQPSTCDCPDASAYTYASTFGITGDGETNDQPALQAALDAAGNQTSNDSGAGGTVILPAGIFHLRSSLIVPAGVTLQGQGYGSSPLAIQFDAGSSVLAYCGEDYAVKMTGHGSGLRNVAVYDWRYPVDTYCDSVKAKGGVLIEANNELVESVTVSEVLVYWFMGEGAAAMTLRAIENGGIAYGNFQNVRVRHAYSGIVLEAEEGSFVNSNSWLGGAISGGITSVGLLAKGPGACNDNKFYGMVIEPSETELAHVYVTGSKTNVRLRDVRLEGTDMFAQDKPLVIVDDSSYGNVMDGMLGHTNIQADLNRNPGIDFTSGKTLGLDPAPYNMLWNAAFKGFDPSSRTLAGWKLPGSNWNVLVLPDTDALHADHKVLDIDYLNYGGAFKLEPENIPKSPGHSFVSFGIYARSTTSGSITAAMRYTSGSIISSSSHSGSGDWEFIGMSALYDKNAPYFYFSITGDVEITAPSFVYGQTPGIPGASLLSTSGGRMSGTLSMGLVKAYPPDPSLNTPYYWSIPTNEGNVFEMDMDGNPSRTIIRLNYRTADRFPRGTVITLLFSEAGTTVKNNGYIKLKDDADFDSVVDSSLTLISHGGASWTEVMRNA